MWVKCISAAMLVQYWSDQRARPFQTTSSFTASCFQDHIRNPDTHTMPGMLGGGHLTLLASRSSVAGSRLSVAVGLSLGFPFCIERLDSLYS